MTYTFENSSPEVIFDYLRQAKTVAVVGLSNREETSSFMVTQALQADGYRIFQSIHDFRVRKYWAKKFMADFKIFLNTLTSWMSFGAQNFYLTLRVILLKQMRMFSGLNKVYKMKRLNKFCVTMVATKSSWIVALKSSMLTVA